ncbi:MAG: hypothetical protein V7606_4357 [Burkholderiales bacterium]
MSDYYAKAAVRKSLLHFMCGKGLSAVVSFLTLIALARWITPEAYGAYVALLALQSGLLALSSLGIETTAERFLPEMRTRYAGDELAGFVIAALATRLASLMLLTCILWFAAQPVVSLAGLERHVDVFRLWMVVIALTGMLSFAIIMLEAMLHQRFAQRCMSIYVCAKLALLAIAYQAQYLQLVGLVTVEVLSTAIAILAAIWSLIRCFPCSELGNGWQMVLENRGRMARFAFFNYIAQAVFLLFNADVMKLFVSKLLGAVQSARFGFAYSLAETVQRYLPAVLLLRLIKPVFVSRYTTTGDFRQLNVMAQIILKLNLLMLVPAIAFAAVFGGDLLSILSGGKYSDAHWVLVGVLSLLIPSSHQLVLSLMAGTVEENAMQLYAGIASTIAFPCALLLIPQWGPLGAVAASGLSGVVYNFAAIFYLRRAGFDYKADLRGVSKLMVAGVFLYGLGAGFHYFAEGWGAKAAIATIGLAGYVALVRFMSVFSVEERASINSLLPKRLFVF